VALIHQRGKKNCYLVRVIALVSVGRSVFRFDFSFYFYRRLLCLGSAVSPCDVPARFGKKGNDREINRINIER
jgi:hypothetical protein